jgi:DNA-binding NtrC family response regulator
MNAAPEKDRRPRILVCDDESVARRATIRALGRATYEFIECADGLGGLDVLGRDDHGVDLVLLDLHMPGTDGMSVLGRLDEISAPPPVVVVTADTSIRAAIDAVKAGAADFLCKPFAVDELRIVVEKTLETARLQRENRRLTAELRRLGGSDELIGDSAAMLEVEEAIQKVAPTTASVLVIGESGTGKELVARRIHRLSDRSSGPFVTVNCAAIPDTLVESELFGHRRGAFTGADRDRPGRFREADSGTLFLDEVGDMTLPAQAKLLRALQEGEVEPLGGGRPVGVDVRIVAATHHDLRQMVTEGDFREDLLFRLRVVDIQIPPLRDRGDDVLVLARHFLDAAAGDGMRLSTEAEWVLRNHGWPGNVRELANAMERAAIFSRDKLIDADDLPADLRGEGSSSTDSSFSLKLDNEVDFQTAKSRVIENFERTILTAALREHGGNVSRVARALGLHRQNVQQKLRRLGISAAEFRES